MANNVVLEIFSIFELYRAIEIICSNNIEFSIMSNSCTDSVFVECVVTDKHVHDELMSLKNWSYNQIQYLNLLSEQALIPFINKVDEKPTEYVFEIKKVISDVHQLTKLLSIKNSIKSASIILVIYKNCMTGTISIVKDDYFDSVVFANYQATIDLILNKQLTIVQDITLSCVHI